MLIQLIILTNYIHSKHEYLTGFYLLIVYALCHNRQAYSISTNVNEKTVYKNTQEFYSQLYCKYNNLLSNSIQLIHHSKRHYCIVTSNILSTSGHVHIHDSLHTTTVKKCIKLIINMFATWAAALYVFLRCRFRQHAQIMDFLQWHTYMTSLACGDDPSVISYEHIKIMAHLIQCSTKTLFPTSHYKSLIQI